MHLKNNSQDINVPNYLKNGINNVNIPNGAVIDENNDIWDKGMPFRMNFGQIPHSPLLDIILQIIIRHYLWILRKNCVYLVVFLLID